MVFAVVVVVVVVGEAFVSFPAAASAAAAAAPALFWLDSSNTKTSSVFREFVSFFTDNTCILFHNEKSQRQNHAGSMAQHQQWREE